MSNPEKCYFCNTKINKIISFDLEKVSSRLLNMSDDKFSFFISDLDTKSCKKCGIKYYSWIKSKNKIKLLQNREISGKMSVNFTTNNSNICSSCNKIFCTVNNLEEKKYKLDGIQFCEYCWNQYVSSFSF